MHPLIRSNGFSLLALAANAHAQTVDRRIGPITMEGELPAQSEIAKQFWSMTVYDIDSRCLIDNPQRKADPSSRQDLKKNADCSIDLYFGPHAPKDFESNWVQTLPGKHWFSYFRLYAPTEAYFDKSWKLDDIRLIQ